MLEYEDAMRLFIEWCILYDGVLDLCLWMQWDYFSSDLDYLMVFWTYDISEIWHSLDYKD